LTFSRNQDHLVVRHTAPGTSEHVSARRVLRCSSHSFRAVILSSWMYLRKD